jgi:hypothetical protein
MAFVNRPTAELSYTFLDGSGNKSQVKFNVPFATLAAAALAAADTLMAALGALSDCVIVSRSLTYSQVDNAPALPELSSRIEEKGTFIFNLANGLKTRFEVPAIKDTLLTASGAIDRSTVTVGAFVTAVTAVDAIFAGADGSDITSLDSAYQKFRRSTRRMLPTDR